MGNRYFTADGWETDEKGVVKTITPFALHLQVMSRDHQAGLALQVQVLTHSGPEVLDQYYLGFQQAALLARDLEALLAALQAPGETRQ